MCGPVGFSFNWKTTDLPSTLTPDCSSGPSGGRRSELVTVWIQTSCQGVWDLFQIWVTVDFWWLWERETKSEEQQQREKQKQNRSCCYDDWEMWRLNTRVCRFTNLQKKHRCVCSWEWEITSDHSLDCFTPSDPLWDSQSTFVLLVCSYVHLFISTTSVVHQWNRKTQLRICLSKITTPPPTPAPSNSDQSDHYYTAAGEAHPVCDWSSSTCVADSLRFLVIWWENKKQSSCSY